MILLIGTAKVMLYFELAKLFIIIFQFFLMGQINQIRCHPQND
jgi:hypothetical protein